MDSVSLKPVIEDLDRLFGVFNDHFFENKLSKPVITVSPDTTRGSYGWCTSWKAWADGSGNETEGYYEINICAEYLNRPFLETCSTLIHEMVHLLNLQEGVHDTSRSGLYHNKRFKEAAEQHGLSVEKHQKYGWCITTLTEEAASWITSMFNNESGFTLHRTKTLKLEAKKKSSSRKYVCPDCGTKVRATKEVRIVCKDCDCLMEEAE